MESGRLEHFVAVAEERSFTRAAARLHIVQSGISASVRALEKELGSRLFERTIQHVELTEAGRALDLAILMTTGPLPGLRLSTLSSESLRLACTADHPLAAREEVELAEGSSTGSSTSRSAGGSGPRPPRARSPGRAHCRCTSCWATSAWTCPRCCSAWAARTSARTRRWRCSRWSCRRARRWPPGASNELLLR
ncbi:DNA-binding transcriptional LysR family regulator [Crossiella equi]|uniref:DNA-binding transcriptional LysR family regulator n=1 Tax=Crossiella equi TaxID=130796 RepID=A0ABS5APE0_9PSEU|nr:DNA-binding transcriptional LysR family regulator [Crossiella equi]